MKILTVVWKGVSLRPRWEAMEDTWISPTDAAGHFGANKDSIRNWIKKRDPKFLPIRSETVNVQKIRA